MRQLGNEEGATRSMNVNDESDKGRHSHGPPKKAWEFHYRSFLSKLGTSPTSTDGHTVKPAKHAEKLGRRPQDPLANTPATSSGLGSIRESTCSPTAKTANTQQQQFNARHHPFQNKNHSHLTGSTAEAISGDEAFQFHKQSSLSKSSHKHAKLKAIPPPQRQSKTQIRAATNDAAIRGGSLFRGIFAKPRRTHSDSSAKTATWNLKDATDTNDSLDTCMRRGVSRESLHSNPSANTQNSDVGMRTSKSIGCMTTAAAVVAPRINPLNGPISPFSDRDVSPSTIRMQASVSGMVSTEGEVLPNSYRRVRSLSLRSAEELGEMDLTLSPRRRNSSGYDTVRKVAFTKFHSSKLYGKDSTSAFLGDETSVRAGTDFQGVFQKRRPQHAELLPAAEQQGNAQSNELSLLQAPWSLSSSQRINDRNDESSGNTLDANCFSLADSCTPVLCPVPPKSKTPSVKDDSTFGVPHMIAPHLLSHFSQDIFSHVIEQSNRILGDDSVKLATEGDCADSSPTSTMFLRTGEMNQAMESQARTSLPFGMTVLGGAFCSPASQSNGVAGSGMQWARCALFVLYHNYLLEFDADPSDLLSSGSFNTHPLPHSSQPLKSQNESGCSKAKASPVGYAHLENSTLSAELNDTSAEGANSNSGEVSNILTLDFFDQPAGATTTGKRRKVMFHCGNPTRRQRWYKLLSTASNLTIDTLYDMSCVNGRNSSPPGFLGRGRYSTIYSARPKAYLREVVGVSGDVSTDVVGKHVRTKGVADNLRESPARALKVISKDQFRHRVGRSKERPDTLVREASVQYTLSCNHACNVNSSHGASSILQLLGMFETKTHLVLELELLEGQDLFSFMSTHLLRVRGEKMDGHSRLPEKIAAEITADILNALVVLKRLGIAHRDVKPANLLMCNTSSASGERLERTPRVKIADYGMASFVGEDGLVRGRCGTPGYVAPEILSSGVQSGYANKVDTFSAGVTLYVMLCGYEPFFGESDEELVKANKLGQLNFPENDWSSVSNEAKNLVRRMMEVDPSKRIEVEEALKHPWITRYNGHLQDSVSCQDNTSTSRVGSNEVCVVS